MRAVIDEWSIGNFTKDCRAEVFLLWKAIPNVRVPLRYLTTRFAAAMCPFDGFSVYFASIFVIVAISGRVDVANHVREPMIDCILRVSLGVMSGSNGSRLILSTGRPLRYGVGGHVTAGPSRLRDVTRVSVKASCVKWQLRWPSSSSL